MQQLLIKQSKTQTMKTQTPNLNLYRNAYSRTIDQFILRGLTAKLGVFHIIIHVYTRMLENISAQRLAQRLSY